MEKYWQRINVDVVVTWNCCYSVHFEVFTKTRHCRPSVAIANPTSPYRPFPMPLHPILSLYAEASFTFQDAAPAHRPTYRYCPLLPPPIFLCLGPHKTYHIVKTHDTPRQLFSFTSFSPRNQYPPTITKTRRRRWVDVATTTLCRYVSLLSISYTPLSSFHPRAFQPILPSHTHITNSHPQNQGGEKKPDGVSTPSGNKSEKVSCHYSRFVFHFFLLLRWRYYLRRLPYVVDYCW